MPIKPTIYCRNRAPCKFILTYQREINIFQNKSHPSHRRGWNSPLNQARYTLVWGCVLQLSVTTSPANTHSQQQTATVWSALLLLMQSPQMEQQSKGLREPQRTPHHDSALLHRHMKTQKSSIDSVRVRRVYIMHIKVNWPCSSASPLAESV